MILRFSIILVMLLTRVVPNTVPKTVPIQCRTLYRHCFGDGIWDHPCQKHHQNDRKSQNHEKGLLSASDNRVFRPRGTHSLPAPPLSAIRGAVPVPSPPGCPTVLSAPHARWAPPIAECPPTLRTSAENFLRTLSALGSVRMFCRVAHDYFCCGDCCVGVVLKIKFTLA